MPARHWFPLTGEQPALAPFLTGHRATPVDPLSGPKLALGGRIVAMDDEFHVLPDAVLYIDKGRIVAAQPRTQAAPPGFEATPVTPTHGTLFPGFIELHNHLAYNALPLWSPVPKLYQDRGQWPTHPDYRKLISGPMTVIGEHRDASGRPALLAPLVRYVE